MLITTENSKDRQQHGRSGPIPMSYGKHPTPFGEALVALTHLGLCHLDFFDDDSTTALSQLRKNWPHANLREDPDATAPLIPAVFTPHLPLSLLQPMPLRLHLRGTDFQLKIWQRLLQVPPGNLISYQDLALSIGQPTAARAVGRAVGQNPICYLIPCHRVVRSDGSIGGYRSGIARKEKLLASEIPHRKSGSGTPV